jgi:hypothetical protein
MYPGNAGRRHRAATCNRYKQCISFARDRCDHGSPYDCWHVEVHLREPEALSQQANRLLLQAVKRGEITYDKRHQQCLDARSLRMQLDLDRRHGRRCSRIEPLRLMRSETIDV